MHCSTVFICSTIKATAFLRLPHLFKLKLKGKNFNEYVAHADTDIVIKAYDDKSISYDI